MKIRAITYFCNPGWPLDEGKIRAAGEFLAEARGAFEAEGYDVQTTRLATIPFPRLLGEKKLGETPKLAQELKRLLQEADISYGALGPALPDMPVSYAVIPEAIAAAENIFFAGIMADGKHGIALKAVHACARIILANAHIQANGFANLNFAALANVPAGAPFFPAAYHEGNEPAFSLAMEAADAAVQAFEMGGTVNEGQNNLVEILEENGRILARVAELLKYKYQVRFGGIDFSLAPFPEKARSTGAAVEAMGVPRTGLHGSLAAAAVLTGAIEKATFPRTGFCGFFQPVLEDAVLAERAAEGTLIVKDLLLHSAVCGTGLDTVPLAGDVSTGQVSALLVDICALALRLDKPLTARLIPIPGKQAGETTEFDFGYFANSRVMGLEAEPLKRSLAGDETFRIDKRNPK
jgi:uncharacterized protein